MKTYIAYSNDSTIFNFLDKEDKIVDIANGDFEHWGKKWNTKTVFQSKHKVNRICSDYNLGITQDNILIKD